VDDCPHAAVTMLDNRVLLSSNSASLSVRITSNDKLQGQEVITYQKDVREP
jgi:hypothetical protein